MNQIQNSDFDSNNQNHYISRKKLATIISIVLVVAAVAVLSKNSYASISDTTNHAAFFTNPFNNIFERSYENTNISNMELTPDTTGLKKGVKKFHFYDKENGTRIHYKAKLKDGKLTDLYIDGEKVSGSELGKYESKIQEKLNEYESVLKDYKRNRDEYRKFVKEYSSKMKDLNKKLSDLGAIRFDFDFENDFDIPKHDLSELRESMKELKHALREEFSNRHITIPPIHIPKIVIPPIEILPVPFDDEELDRWSDEFKENMIEFKEKMTGHKWDMEEFNENMKDFGKRMKIFGIEMKKFRAFIKEMKNELLEDRIIEPGDDIDQLVLSEDRMEVNGKGISAELHKKYKDFYENHTGKKIEGKNRIKIND